MSDYDTGTAWAIGIPIGIALALILHYVFGW